MRGRFDRRVTIEERTATQPDRYLDPGRDPAGDAAGSAGRGTLRGGPGWRVGVGGVYAGGTRVRAGGRNADRG